MISRFPDRRSVQTIVGRLRLGMGDDIADVSGWAAVAAWSDCTGATTWRRFAVWARSPGSRSDARMYSTRIEYR